MPNIQPDPILIQLQETVLYIKELIEKLDKNKKAMEPYLTSKQVMELLQVTENTLQRMRIEHRIEFVQIGNFTFRYPSNQYVISAKVS